MHNAIWSSILYGIILVYGRIHTIGSGHWYDQSQPDMSIEAVTISIIIIAIVYIKWYPNRVQRDSQFPQKLRNGLFCCQYSPSQPACHDTYQRCRWAGYTSNQHHEDDYSVVSMVSDDMVLVVVVDDPLFVQLSTVSKRMIFLCHWHFTLNYRPVQRHGSVLKLLHSIVRRKLLFFHGEYFENTYLIE
jgi:hypothetical protein